MQKQTHSDSHGHQRETETETEAETGTGPRSQWQEQGQNRDRHETATETQTEAETRDRYRAIREAPRVHKVSPWVQNAPLGLKGLLSTPSASRAYFVRPWPFLLCSQNSPESERDRRDAKTRKERHHQYESYWKCRAGQQALRKCPGPMCSVTRQCQAGKKLIP